MYVEVVLVCEIVVLPCLTFQEKKADFKYSEDEKNVNKFKSKKQTESSQSHKAKPKQCMLKNLTSKVQ